MTMKSKKTLFIIPSCLLIVYEIESLKVYELANRIQNDNAYFYLNEHVIVFMMLKMQLWYYEFISGILGIYSNLF